MVGRRLYAGCGGLRKKKRPFLPAALTWSGRMAGSAGGAEGGRLLEVGARACPLSRLGNGGRVRKYEMVGSGRVGAARFVKEEKKAPP